MTDNTKPIADTQTTGTTVEQETLTADVNYLQLAASSMGVPLRELINYATAPDQVAQQHRAIIESFLRADSDSTLGEMLKDMPRFQRAATAALEQLDRPSPALIEEAAKQQQQQSDAALRERIATEAAKPEHAINLGVKPGEAKKGG